jgi:hypothetical protein
MAITEKNRVQGSFPISQSRFLVAPLFGQRLKTKLQMGMSPTQKSEAAISAIFFSKNTTHIYSYIYPQSDLL